MKDLVKKLAIGVVSVACVFSMAACTSNDNDKTNKPEEGTNGDFAERQIALAKDTFNSFYNKGELFSAQKDSVSAASYALTKDIVGQAESSSFDEVRNALAEYSHSGNVTLNLLNSYVADIFSYSQVQTSIINQFGESALTDVYALNYDKVDWASDTTSWAQWINSTKLLSAAFAGTDVDNGNVYCSQAHVSNGVLVMANLEYFYNSDSDMGVTTLNWHSGGRFEYHFCSAGTSEILYAYGNHHENGDISLNGFTFYRYDGVVTDSYCSIDDLQLVYNFINSEISRINGKIETLQEQNGRERLLQGDEEADNLEENIGVCSVEFDFSILSRMLLKKI